MKVLVTEFQDTWRAMKGSVVVVPPKVCSKYVGFLPVASDYFRVFD
jgi:hypothetical protein